MLCRNVLGSIEIKNKIYCFLTKQKKLLGQLNILSFKLVHQNGISYTIELVTSYIMINYAHQRQKERGQQLDNGKSEI